MNSLKEIIKKILENKSDDICVRQICGGTITYKELTNCVEKTISKIRNFDDKTSKRLVGIAMPASIDWTVADFSLMMLDAVSLPIPLEFSDEQIQSLLHNADYCLVNDEKVSERIKSVLPELTQINIHGEVINAHNIPEKTEWQHLGEQGIIKVIHTSGTTSNPKGVLIKDDAVGLLMNTLTELHEHLGPLHYLSLVPFSLLIEQVLGIYLPLMSGGSLTILPLNVPPFGVQNGLSKKYLKFIPIAKPNFIYMPPKLLEEIHTKLIDGEELEDLFGDVTPYIITGGAKINSEIIEALTLLGVEIYEAYGLSEHSSIVTLNTRCRRKIGTPGAFLPYVDYRIEDGELLIKSPTLSPGYLSKDSTACDMTGDGYLKTGDIVEIDEDGFLHIQGRKKHVIILSNARNVCPEWVEMQYKSCPSIADIVVIGDGMDHLSAIVVSNKNTTKYKLLHEMCSAGHRLSVFSKVKDFVVRDDDRFREEYYTITGRPRREKIETYFKENTNKSLTLACY